VTAAHHLRRIQSYLRVAAPSGRDHARIGPFLATFNRETDNPYLNYAIPDDDAAPTADDVAALVAAYREAERKPRLEYIPAVAPAVEAVLLEGSFEVEARTPLMVYDPTAATAPPVPAGIELVAASADAELRAAAAVQWEAYEEQGPVAEHAVRGLRRTLEAGGIVALARDEASGEPAGAGLCGAPHDASTELAAVGVRPSFRRRGIAAAMTGWLAARAAERGIENVFLMADSEAEARIYARAGFRAVSEVLHIGRGEDGRS
jgi:ribosomal protein S18 acetylase RimI-like enzyme